MTVRRVVAENLGYALLGGPVLGIISFLAGTYFHGTVAGVGCALAVYGLGWTLTVRESERETRGTASDADAERTRRERELDAEKGGFGGDGGGG